MINSIHNQIAIQRQTQNGAAPQSATKKIASSFQETFDEVNRSQLEATAKVNEMVAGKNKDIVGTIISMEKADISMRMMMAVRNKVVSAYQEMMRMQV